MQSHAVVLSGGSPCSSGFLSREATTPDDSTRHEVRQIRRHFAPACLSFYDGYADPREIALWDAFVAERRA